MESSRTVRWGEFSDLRSETRVGLLEPELASSTGYATSFLWRCLVVWATYMLQSNSLPAAARPSRPACGRGGARRVPPVRTLFAQEARWSSTLAEMIGWIHGSPTRVSRRCVKQEGDAAGVRGQLELPVRSRRRRSTNKGVARSTLRLGAAHWDRTEKRNRKACV